MSDEDNRVIGSESAAIPRPVDALKVLSGLWIPTKRYVVPHYELVISEQRVPDDRYLPGYRSRRYSAIPHFAVVNTQPKILHMFVSFASFEGSAHLDMAYEGSLDQRTSVVFNVANHPKLQLPHLPDEVTGADVYWVRQGWFDIHASAEVQVDAWISYAEDPIGVPVGPRWMRTLPVQESSYIRNDAWFPKKSVALGPM